MFGTIGCSIIYPKILAGLLGCFTSARVGASRGFRPHKILAQHDLLLEPELGCELSIAAPASHQWSTSRATSCWPIPGVPTASFGEVRTQTRALGPAGAHVGSVSGLRRRRPIQAAGVRNTWMSRSRIF